MKRTKVTLLMLILMISSASFAQKMSLCEAFLKIVDASNNSFADIKKDVVDPSKLIKVYGSGIEIAEANKTELKVVLTDPDFTASYGTFNSETEAKAKIQELTDKFGVCYPTVKFCNYYYDMFKSARTNFINFADKGFRYYEAYFEINKLGNTYEVLFICPPAEKTGYGANAKATPTFSDYYFNTVSQDNQQFSQDIRKIILESENNFENFKGDKVDMGYSFFQNYSSKFQVSGITNCYIEKHTARIVNFVIPLLENTDIETLKKQSPLLIQNLMAALGTDYAYNVSEDQTKVVFVNKNSPQKKVVTFLIQQKGNGFNVNIYINADSQI